MGWALITHPKHVALAEKGVTILPTLIQERDLYWALAQDWIVIIRESDLGVAATDPAEMPAQSNPRRVVDRWRDGRICD